MDEGEKIKISADGSQKRKGLIYIYMREERRRIQKDQRD